MSLHFLGENAIVIVKGANELISREDLIDAQSVIQKSKVMICQLEINPDITLEALKMAKLYGGILLISCCILQEFPVFVVVVLYFQLNL